MGVVGLSQRNLVVQAASQFHKKKSFASWPLLGSRLTTFRGVFQNRAPRGFDNFYPKRNPTGRKNHSNQNAKQSGEKGANGNGSSSSEGAAGAAGKNRGGGNGSRDGESLKDVLGGFVSKQGTKQGKGGSGKGTGGEPGGGGGVPEPPPMPGLYVALVMGALFFFFGMGDKSGVSGGGREISWQDFKTELLSSGLVRI